ncbi:SDR family oxidoreductase [Streptomyces kanamyceticus]|uniref:NAD-dependent epimerase/dehydratase family protein n=1 Tax=Streptomyces kanamyceticus TaxID=1967 RepID=A0A5J6GLD0_STRKN|nr:NAD(P)H-binding protein [Streptomyces kanamyceticus]QEU96269.1 NAD-dependent epimerase/dehydratase family protein [Streptomyces kanamyceticus]
MTILVTGATGNVGRRVVGELLRAGEDVRALTRRPDSAGLPAGVEVVAGDMARPQTLRDALTGVERMFLFPVLEAAQEVIDLAVKAGVRRIVLLSSATVTAGWDTEYHLPVERAVEASGVEWTHVRPGEFAVNSLHMWGPSVRARRTVVEPYPDRVGIPIHEWDIADVAAAALVEEGHVGTAYTLSGPGPVTPREQVAAIAEAIGEEIRIETVTPAEARAFYHEQGGWAAANVDFLFGYEDYSGVESDPDEPGDADEPEQAEPETAPGTVTADAVTGRAPRSYLTWAHDHADDFR